MFELNKFEINSTENIVILSTAIVATIIAILTVLIAIFLLHFIHPKQKKTRIMTLKRGAETKQETIKTSKYFAISSASVVIFNAFCSVFDAIYCLYLIFDPYQDDTLIYYQHPSYYFRILSTVCWYIGTISVIWFFNGRLFYAFKGSAFKISKTLWKFINVFISIFGLISLIFAYTGVYLDSFILQEVSFSSFRIAYQIIIFLLLYLFSKRFLLLTIQHQSMPLIRFQPNSTFTKKNAQVTVQKSKGIEMIIHAEEKNDSDASHKSVNKSKNEPHNVHGINFLEVTARNSVLVFVTSTSVFLVTVLWSSFRWLLVPRSRLTLLVPMNMASVDSLINSVSIIMLFPFGDKLYVTLCCACHKCFKHICGSCAKARVLHV